MDWFQNKTTQLIALAGIVSTLAGFGYTGATYVNRIENLESKMTRYINEIDALADQVTALDKNVVADRDWETIPAKAISCVVLF